MQASKPSSINFVYWRACASVVFAAMFAIAIVGCRDTKTGPATVQVTGTVTLDGNALEGASVIFSPGLGSDDGRLSSQATTDKDGRFRLSTNVGLGKLKSGIVPGKYDVTVVKTDLSSIKNTLSPPRNMLPPKYADAKTSGFKADVVAGQSNDFPFALKKE
jgi:hypothetical protein